jgi:hypothetical protein
MIESGGKGGAIMAVVEREELVSAEQSRSANQKIGEDALRTSIALSSPGRCVGWKGAAGGSRVSFVPLPVNGNTCLVEKIREKGLCLTGRSQ